MEILQKSSFFPSDAISFLNLNKKKRCSVYTIEKLLIRFLYRKPNSGLQNRVEVFCQMGERRFKFQLGILTQTINSSLVCKIEFGFEPFDDQQRTKKKLA
jgi:hypothetical protein